MSSQIKTYRKKWNTLNKQAQRLFLLRMLASITIFILGCGIIFNMRAKVVGEDGASLAMYFMGVLFILVGNIAIFAGKLRSPEKLALKMCIAAVILTGAWVNFEEKVVMPLIASDCEDEVCTIFYERAIPFSDVVMIYREGRGWRVLE